MPLPEKYQSLKCCPLPVQALLALAVWFLVYFQLDPFAAWFTYDLVGLTKESHLGGAVEFFVADAPKVLMLLVLITFIVGITRTFLTPERIRTMLAGRRGIAGYVLAAILGVPTPFCSCSAIPLFLGFLQSGIPLGITDVVPHLLPRSERNCPRDALRNVRMEDRHALCHHWA